VKKKGEILDIVHLLKHVEKNLDSYKHLRGGLYVMDRLPKNVQGKLQRKQLIEMLSKIKDD